MVIDAFASLPHYAEHLWPVWQALPEEARGTFWTAGIYMAGQPGTPLGPKGLRAVGGLVLVAAAADTQNLDGRKFVLLEHGAGQTYEGIRSRSYSGSDGWGDCVLFLCPNETVANRWAARYPDARTAVVGCPRLDRWHATSGVEIPPPMSQSVAITFHWDNPLLPETRWAFPHFKAGLETFRDDCASLGFTLLGHGHPRAWGQLKRWWAMFGITPAETWGEIMGASVLVGDNTSALPEFASLGRPVVWMNAPTYRRDVHHGGRFWEWPEGQPQADDRTQLRGALIRALYDEGAEDRRRMVRSIYAHTDGHAADRAAAAIVEVL